jgi:glycerol-3-phosphate dehydrogenase subunit C
MLPVNGIDHCLKCSICQASCPVVRVSPDFPGPKILGPDLGRFDRGRTTVPGAEWCTNCQRCEIACPHGVEAAGLIRSLKNEGLHEKKHYWRDLLMGYPHLLGQLGTTCSPLANFLLGNRAGQNVTARMMALAPDSSLPNYAGQSFQNWYRGNRNSGNSKVVYFAGCFTNFNRPEIGQALVALLKMLNIEVIVPRQVCCGVPLLSNGFRQRALKLMEDNLQSLLPYVESGCSIICSCPSCGLALKKEYPRELGAVAASRLSASVYDFAEYLEMYGQNLAEHLLPQPWKITYHQPCHTLAQGIGTPSLHLLRKIPGVQASLVDGCCGQSGTYGLKREKSGVARQIGRQLVENITSGSPDLVVTDCGACSLQIGGLSDLQVEHPLVVLRRAMEIQGSF